MKKTKTPKAIRTGMLESKNSQMFLIEISKESLVNAGWELNPLADVYSVEVCPLKKGKK